MLRVAPDAAEKAIDRGFLRDLRRGGRYRSSAPDSVAATIALWLGHERLETTHQYVEADLQLKEDALRKLEPLGQRTERFKADSSLLAFLASL